MGATIVLAWRNIWRNTRRTIITAAAIGLGLAALLVTMGLMRGMMTHFVEVSTGSLVGDAQIHAAAYRAVRDETMVLPDPGDVLARADATPGVRAAAPRAYATALLAVGDRAEAVQAIGIDPVRERRVTTWEDRLVAGKYPEDEGDVLIGRDLAEDLDVEVGTRLVMTIADAQTGDLNSLAVRVSGIVASANPAVDERTAILALPVVQRALGMPGAVHEIALRLDLEGTQTEALARAVLLPLQAPELDVEPWQELLPLASQIIDMQSAYLAITGFIVFIIIALGIMNTLSMSLIERTHEFGVLRAIGTTPLGLLRLILAEAAWLGAVGSAIGVAIGLALHWPLARWGLRLTETDIAGVSFAARIHAELSAGVVVAAAALFVAMTTLVAVVVAVRAARIQPAVALREV